MVHDVRIFSLNNLRVNGAFRIHVPFDSLILLTVGDNVIKGQITIIRYVNYFDLYHLKIYINNDSIWKFNQQAGG